MFWDIVVVHDFDCTDDENSKDNSVTERANNFNIHCKGDFSIDSHQLSIWFRFSTVTPDYGNQTLSTFSVYSQPQCDFDCIRVWLKNISIDIKVLVKQPDTILARANTFSLLWDIQHT